MKRITVDLEDPLYRRFKVHAALSGRNMADVVRELLDASLPGLPDNPGSEWWELSPGGPGES